MSARRDIQECPLLCLLYGGVIDIVVPEAELPDICASDKALVASQHVIS